MKLYEAMKLLDEDPSRKFEYQGYQKKWLLYADVCYDGSVFYMLDCWDKSGELRTGTVFGSLHGNLTTSDNWQLVREPVTWQEAIEAWADGKKISYSYGGYDRWSPFEDSNAMMLTIQKIKEAEWYVEDVE